MTKGKKRKFKCKDCGTTEGVKYTTCPYASEVHNETVKVRLCDKCYHERFMDT